ncbi:MAG: serine/threonine protein kinase, partial [Myxococcales bacterium]|nr:serine/threonine protein kinase [Myxococcales bacterium]
MVNPIPAHIGRYDVERLLGSGAMGHVYLARDPVLDRPVAIKTVRALSGEGDHGDPAGTARAVFLERFRNEARAAAKVHHPNIVQVYDVGEDAEAGPFVVFEYVPGPTLKDVLRERGPFGPEQAVRWVEDAAAGLAAAHAHGIIHRDVKPENLLLTPEGRVKLADFGVARLPNAALTGAGQFLGTPCYAAPETLTTGEVGPESDLFSLAAVLYEILSGARAFPGKQAIAVARSVVHDDPRPLRAVRPDAAPPREVQRVLDRGLAKDPARRFESVTAFARALRAAYAKAGLLAPADGGAGAPGAGEARGPD